MGRAVDLSREQVSRLESGISEPQPRTIDRVAHAFGLPAEKLKEPLLAAGRIEDLITVAKLHLESQSGSGTVKGLDRFGQFVIWFRSMSSSDQSLTLAALQRIHEDSLQTGPVTTSQKSSKSH